MSATETAWCPGCGNFPILKTLDEAIEAAGINRKNLVLVSGIGQAAKLPHYTQANVFNGLHGRAAERPGAPEGDVHEPVPERDLVPLGVRRRRYVDRGGSGP